MCVRQCVSVSVCVCVNHRQSLPRMFVPTPHLHTRCSMAEFLRSKNPAIKIALTDPEGANLYRFYTEGELKCHGSSITEGIGQARITGNLEGFKPDYAFEVC